MIIVRIVRYRLPHRHPTQAYVIELSVRDPKLLKTRQTMVMAMNMATPMVLSPIGGAVSTFGLEIPFWVSAGMAFLGIFFAMRS